MLLRTFCEWLQDTQFATALRESQYVYPIVESVHVLALTASAGLILVADLRLIGTAFRREPAGAITRQIKPWMLTGFFFMFVSGSLLFAANAAKCYGNSAFRFKLLFLILAGLNAGAFEVTLGRTKDRWGMAADSPGLAKAAGWISLICWLAVITLGRWTAYTVK